MSIKKLVFVKGIIETLSHFSEELALFFQSQGYEIFMFDDRERQLAKTKLERFIQKKQTAFITFNFIGLSGEEIFKDSSTESVWESMQIKVYNILVDHPLYYYKQFMKKNTDMYLFCLDKKHVSFVKRFFLDVKVAFMPMAGNQMISEWSSISKSLSGNPFEMEKEAILGTQRQEMIPYSDRKYELVFAGNYANLKPLEEKCKTQSKEYIDFYHEIIEMGKTDIDGSIETLLEKSLKKEMPDLKEQELVLGMSSVIFLDIYIRAYFRNQVIMALAKKEIPVFLIGKDWGNLECKGKEYLSYSNGMLASEECIQIIKNSKMSLNVMPGFKDGSHDRIYTSMLQRSLVLTDKSEYLEETCKDFDTICYYDIKNLQSLPEKILQLRKDETLAEKIADHGYHYARYNHTWAERGKFLLKYFE